MRRVTWFPSSPGLQQLRQLPRRSAPVANRVLLAGVELRHRAAVLGTGVGRDECRVVAEAAGSPRLIGQRPLATPLDQVLAPVGVHIRERTDVRDRAVLGSRELTQKEVQVLLV